MEKGEAGTLGVEAPPLELEEDYRKYTGVGAECGEAEGVGLRRNCSWAGLVRRRRKMIKKIRLEESETKDA